MASPPLRKDSARTRAAILAAAEERLAADAGASFAEISIDAGVSQATVYRHFPDRSSLLVGLMERSLEEIETEVEGWEIGPDSFFDLLTLMSTQQARYQGVLSAVRRGEVEGSGMVGLEDRTREVLREPLLAATAADRLRDDLEADDVLQLLGMIDGALSAVKDRGERDAAAARAVSILLHGVVK